MSNTASQQPQTAAPQTREPGTKRIRMLLQQYPATSSEENREIALWLTKGPLLDIGLMRGDESLRYKIAAFEQEHSKIISNKPLQIIVLLAIFLLTALACFALWDVGAL